ncbi:MAG: hypothetical protein IKL02_10525 [Kiritimatiellae bacterium]|nr:hypothetical protein [Kiritimatiellia bacterium]
MMMDAYKISDNYNFQRTEGCKMISPHHFYPTNGPADSDILGALDDIATADDAMHDVAESIENLLKDLGFIEE